MKPFSAIISPRAAAIAAVVAAVAPMPALADFVGVSRCAAADGTNTPALHFVVGGDRFLAVAGSGGLTRSIIFNERAALEWARNSGLFPEDTVFGNYSDHICGVLNEDDDPEPEPIQAPSQREPEPPEQCTECEFID